MHCRTYLKAVLFLVCCSMHTTDTIGQSTLSGISLRQPSRITVYSSDNTLKVERNSAGEILVKSSVKDSIIWAFAGERPWVWRYAVSPRDCVLATVTDDGVVAMWDLRTGRCLQVIRVTDRSLSKPVNLYFDEADKFCVTGQHEYCFAIDTLTELVINPSLEVAGRSNKGCPPIDALTPFELAPQPLPGFTPRPTYPETASGTGITGRVVIAVCVGKDGRVRDSAIISSRPTGLGFEDAVKSVIEKWQFTPALQQGIPIEVWFGVPFEIKPE